jgi:hypothetical protein
VLAAAATGPFGNSFIAVQADTRGVLLLSNVVVTYQLPGSRTLDRVTLTDLPRLVGASVVMSINGDWSLLIRTHTNLILWFAMLGRIFVDLSYYTTEHRDQHQNQTSQWWHGFVGPRLFAGPLMSPLVLRVDQTPGQNFTATPFTIELGPVQQATTSARNRLVVQVQNQSLFFDGEMNFLASLPGDVCAISSQSSTIVFNAQPDVHVWT